VAVAACKDRLVRGIGGRVPVIARAGAVRIHRANPLGMVALVVRCRVLYALDERLERHALQPNGSD